MTQMMQTWMVQRQVLSLAWDVANASKPCRPFAQCKTFALRKDVLGKTAIRQAPLTTSMLAASADTVTADPPLASGDATVGKVHLYNTMSRSKELFQPRPGQGNQVAMYVCGVTVYDYSHIGHARAYVTYDILLRLLQHMRFEVTYVRNFTDIDDKIINRANEAGEDPLALSQRFIHEFHADMDALGCLRPAMEPKATDYVPQMISAIQRIIANGHGYAVGGDVFFDVQSLPGYGKLSGRQQDDNQAGIRVDVDDRKRNAADFSLWKAAKPGEPTWDSPWGPGRPGWHIECSTMIEELMGSIIDIHGGGRDLIFPHHENELAQSRAAAGNCSCGQSHDNAEFVRFWVHNGFVNVDSEKMSKSLGNFFTIRDVLHQYSAMALRWFLISCQYRQPVNYTQAALEEASDRLFYLQTTLLEAQQVLAEAGEAGDNAIAAAQHDLQNRDGETDNAAVRDGLAMLRACEAALADDLNTPSAVAELSQPLKVVNELVNSKQGRKNPQRVALLAGWCACLRAALGLLGIPDGQEIVDDLKAKALTRAGLSEADVQQKIEERKAARQAKDYAASDRIRDELSGRGIMIMDSPQGTTWRPVPVVPQ